MNEKNELTPKQQWQWYFDDAEAGDEQAQRELARMCWLGFTHPDDPTVEIEPDAD